MLQTLGPEQELTHTLVALSDPTRRAIVRRLARGEARVTEVAEPFAMSLNAVSKHIQVLERARLVVRRRAGRDHFLSLDLAPLDEASAWIEATRAFWSARLDALDELLREERSTAERSTAGRSTTGRSTPRRLKQRPSQPKGKKKR